MTAAMPTRPQAVLTGTSMRAFHGRIEVVFGVDISLAAGELVVLLGANGAGKSSLLGAIAGSVRSAGEVDLAGRSIARLSAQQRAARGLGFVPERRANVFAPMSVAENIDIGLRLSSRERRGVVRGQLLDLFPILRERERAQAGALSGGEQQMLAIAMALGREPAVLVLDEPSQGLAPVVFDHLQQAFQILRDKGLALLVAEQNLPFAAQVADRYVVLSHGAVVASGGKDDLRSQSDMLDTFLNE
jgi:branched-chain amino acid transport system ATP-binding protein